MNYLSSAPLSVSGLPILQPNEVELKSEANIVVKHHDDIKKSINELFSSCLLILTNFRLIIINNYDATTTNTKSSSTSHKLEHDKIIHIGWGIDLKNISSIEEFNSGTFAFVQNKVKVCLHNSNLSSFVVIKFEKQGKEEFMKLINKALENKSWEKYATGEKLNNGNNKVSVFSSANAGVAGIIRRQEQSIQSVDSLTKVALTDLDALMLRAREAVQVIQRYASYIDMSAHDSNSNSPNDHDDDDNDSYSETTSQAGERNEMETILQNIGIISPITKYSAGRMYHQQLARQIADILLQQNRLVRLGGMITLTDLYCLLNKARGTELVSPDDLLKAASLTNKLHLGLQLHIFDSGVKVLKLNNYNEKELSEKILKLIATFNSKDSNSIIYNKDGSDNSKNISKTVDDNDDNSQSDKDIYQIGVQASDVSSHFNISIIIAKEQLLLCEQYQYLCRDESIDGLFFYPNLF